jgi:hypothetical protein
VYKKMQVVLSSCHPSKCPTYLLLPGIELRSPCSPAQNKIYIDIAVSKASLLHPANQSIVIRPLQCIAILVPVECTGRPVNSCSSLTQNLTWPPSFLFQSFEALCLRNRFPLFRVRKQPIYYYILPLLSRSQMLYIYIYKKQFGIVTEENIHVLQ